MNASDRCKSTNGELSTLGSDIVWGYHTGLHFEELGYCPHCFCVIDENTSKTKCERCGRNVIWNLYN